MHILGDHTVKNTVDIYCEIQIKEITSRIYALLESKRNEMSLIPIPNGITFYILFGSLAEILSAEVFKIVAQNNSKEAIAAKGILLKLIQELDGVIVSPEEAEKYKGIYNEFMKIMKRNTLMDGCSMRYILAKAIVSG